MKALSKISGLGIIFALVLAAASPILAAPPPGPTPGPVPPQIPLVDPAIEKMVTTYMNGDSHVPGLVIGVIEVTGSDAPKYSAGFFGVASLDTNQLPAANTLFEIGSETKLFTAVLLAYFVQEGRVKLDDPIQKYLPPDVHAPTFNGQPITLLDLATHRSGLPDYPDNRVAGDPSSYTLQDLYNWLNSYQLTRAPGSQWEYSNIGFGLLGALLAQIAGQSYEDLIKQYFDQPLNMPDTVVFPSDEQKQRLAVGYNAKGKPATPFYQRSSPSVEGAGQLYSTLDDMFQFAAANLDLLGPDFAPAFDLTQQIYADAGTPDAKMGLAWQMSPVQDTAGTRIDWKDGLTDGFHSYVAIFKTSDRKYAVILLGNGRTKDGLEPLGSRIIKLLVDAKG